LQFLKPVGCWQWQEITQLQLLGSVLFLGFISGMWHPTNKLCQCRRGYKTVQVQLSLAKYAAGGQMVKQSLKVSKKTTASTYVVVY